MTWKRIAEEDPAAKTLTNAHSDAYNRVLGTKSHSELKDMGTLQLHLLASHPRSILGKFVLMAADRVRDIHNRIKKDPSNPLWHEELTHAILSSAANIWAHHMDIHNNDASVDHGHEGSESEAGRAASQEFARSWDAAVQKPSE